MKWKNKIEKPVEGDYKIKKRFAWKPKQVGDYKIWLSFYEELYEWKVRERAFTCPFTYFTFRGSWGDWDLINTRISNNIKNESNRRTITSQSRSITE